MHINTNAIAPSAADVLAQNLVRTRFSSTLRREIRVVAQSQEMGENSASGAGKRYALDLCMRLIMLIVWLRLYSTIALGCWSDLHQLHTNRNRRPLLMVLRKVRASEYERPESPFKGQGRIENSRLSRELRAFRGFLLNFTTTLQLSGKS